MSTHSPSGRMHPLMAAAAVSVTLVSLIGVAAITGILPASHSTNALTAEAQIEQSQAQQKPAGTAEDSAKLAASDNGLVGEEPAAPRKPARHATASHVRSSQGRASYDAPTSVAQADVCHSCGRVEAVHAIKQKAQPSGVGVVAGAVLGGLLGNHVGGGNGRKVATVAGAVGGGYAGNEVEKNVRATTSYEVRVRMEDGSVRNFPYTSQPNWVAGDRVRVVNGNLTAQG